MAKSTEDAASDEPEKVTSELVILHDRLDGLWERYLELLARYQRAQQDAQKFLSSVRFHHPALISRTSLTLLPGILLTHPSQLQVPGPETVRSGLLRRADESFETMSHED